MPKPSRSTSRSFKIREEALGPEHPDVAGSLNNLAAAVPGPRPLRRSREPLYQRSLEKIRQKALIAIGRIPVAGELEQPGQCCTRAQGRYAQAEPLYQRAKLRDW